MFKITLTAVAVAVITSVGWNTYIENIILAKNRDFRIMEVGYSKRLHDAQLAYDDIATLNAITERECANNGGGATGPRSHSGNRVMMDASSNQGRVDHVKPR